MGASAALQAGLRSCSKKSGAKTPQRDSPTEGESRCALKRSILFRDDGCPAVCIGLVTVLNGAQLVVEFNTSRSGFPVFTDEVLLAGIQVVDATNGTDYSGSATGTHFLKSFQLLQGHLTSLGLHAHVLGQLKQTLIGDGGQNRFRFGRDVGVVLNAEEVGRSAFVDEFFLPAVEVQYGRVAFFFGNFAGTETGRVVTAHLVGTCAVGRCPVVLPGNHQVGALKAFLKVGANWGYKDHKQVLIGRRNAHLGARTNQEGTNVEGCATLVGRQI